MKEDLYLEQKGNCFLSLVISFVFIIGVIYKSIINFTSTDIIKENILIILPILFMNGIFFSMLDLYKRALNNNLFNKKTNKHINNIILLLMIFVLSIMLVIYNDAHFKYTLLILIIVTITLLYSGLLVKKIYNNEVEKNK